MPVGQMQNEEKSKAAATARSAERARRLAEALRENLLRRKQQARARVRQQDEPDGTG